MNKKNGYSWKFRVISFPINFRIKYLQDVLNVKAYTNEHLKLTTATEALNEQRHQHKTLYMWAAWEKQYFFIVY